MEGQVQVTHCFHPHRKDSNWTGPHGARDETTTERCCFCGKDRRRSQHFEPHQLDGHGTWAPKVLEAKGEGAWSIADEAECEGRS